MKSEEKSKIDELYMEVTSAIRFAEELEDVDPKGQSTAKAFANVAHLEAHIGMQLQWAGKWGCFEWEIAWRGAVRASMKAGDPQQAKNYVAGVKAGSQVDQKFVDELESLLG